MRKSVLAVCDAEPMYVYNLMEYIHSKKGDEFDVQAFTGIKSLSDFTQERKVDMLLISDALMCSQVKELDIRKIMILSGGEQFCELSDYPAVYKYQAADSLVKELLDCYAQVKPPASEPLFRRKVEVIGIYSPVKRTGKTSFALTLGQVLASSRAVLYINLEDYAGFDTLMGKTFSSDITDLMYFSGEGEKNLVCRIGGIVQCVNNLDYIPPAFSPYDLRSVKGEEWLKLIEELCLYGSYDVILLDLGEQVDKLPEILDRCGKIYMPVREDSLASAKVQQYEKVMLAQEREDLLGRTKKIKVPYHGSPGKKELYVEQLVWGELGDFVRRLIREEDKI